MALKIGSCNSYSVDNSFFAVPILTDDNDSVLSITDVFCDAEGMHTSRLSLCFSFENVDNQNSFYIYVRNADGQWFKSEACKYIDLLDVAELNLSVTPCDDPREHDDSGDVEPRE